MDYKNIFVENRNMVKHIESINKRHESDNRFSSHVGTVMKYLILLLRNNEAVQTFHDQWYVMPAVLPHPHKDLGNEEIYKPVHEEINKLKKTKLT